MDYMYIKLWEHLEGIEYIKNMEIYLTGCCLLVLESSSFAQEVLCQCLVVGNFFYSSENRTLQRSRWTIKHNNWCKLPQVDLWCEGTISTFIFGKKGCFSRHYAKAGRKKKEEKKCPISRSGGTWYRQNTSIPMQFQRWVNNHSNHLLMNDKNIPNLNTMA